jgi:hypothetical protein
MLDTSHRVPEAALIFLLLAVPLCIAGASSPARGAVLAGPIPNPANGHLYYLLAQGDWHRAEAEALALGGHLATIGDPHENDWVYETFGAYRGTPRHLWIGLTDEGHEGLVVWTNGEPVGFTNWYETQPDNADGREHCAHIVAPWYSPEGGRWNDLDGRWTSASGYPMHGVVEVELHAGVPGTNRRLAAARVAASKPRTATLPAESRRCPGASRQCSGRAVATGPASPGIARTPETLPRQSGSNLETWVPALTAAW